MQRQLLAQQITCKVTDFSHNFTHPPIFRAPEIINLAFSSSGDDMSEKYSMPADIWSFGMVTYEILTLQLPYAVLKLYEAVDRISAGKKPDIPPLTGGFPTEEDLEGYEPVLEIIEKTAVFEPEKRPTAIDLLSMIESKITW